MQQLVLNWFRANKQFSNGTVEGLNANAKPAFGKAHGYRTLQAAQVSLRHQLGHLPQPKLAHAFCRGGFFHFFVDWAVKYDILLVQFRD